MEYNIKNLTRKQKIALIGAVLYTIIIGIGMYISFHVNGVDYTKPELVNTLWTVEIILTSLTLFLTAKYFSWKEVGFVKLQTKQLLWFIPSIIVLGLMCVMLFELFTENDLSAEKLKLIALVGFTTLLVGFSEELMYRGILFNSLLKTHSKTTAVLISSIAFSLLHSVNIFGGLDLGSMLIQLVLTFLFGLFFALIFIRIKNIIPLIIFHWLWDFALISSSVISSDNEVGSVGTIHFLIEIILIIILFIYLKKINEISVEL